MSEQHPILKMVHRVVLLVALGASACATGADLAAPPPGSNVVVVRGPWGRPRVVVYTSRLAPDRCERGWYTTRGGYCCPLGYDDAGNGTCNPSATLVEASR